VIARSTLGARGLVAWSALCLSACNSSGLQASQPPSPMSVAAAGASAGQSGASAPAQAVSPTGTRSDAGVAHAGKADAATVADGLDTDAGPADPSSMTPAHPDLRCKADSSLPQKTDFSQVGPRMVGTLDVTFTDTSRPIVATAKHAAAPSRTLVTTIYYPSSGPAPLGGSAPLAGGGPFPMLMYSHGYSSNRGEATRVANRLASYGYIIVSPDFPLTNIQSNNSHPDIDDAANQPGDVSYLIDQLLAFSHDPKHLLASGVDEARIGALGVSLGGLTTLLVTFHPKFHDPRIKVAMPIAALSGFFAEGFYHTRDLPVLLVHGDLDAIVNYQLNARRAFTRAMPNARLLTVAKGTHSAFGFAFSASVVPLLNAFVALPNSDPSNADGLGCGAVGKDLQMTGPEFITALGDANDFIDADEANLRPCEGDEYKKPAIDPEEQEDIVLRSAVPFFNAHLGSTADIRQDGCRYLVYEIPKHAGVTLE
jgi:dienelactone hydrolase